MKALFIQQDPKSTVPPTRWLALQIHGWESPGWGATRAVIRHTQDQDDRTDMWDEVHADVERAFAATFGD